MLQVAVIPIMCWSTCCNLFTSSHQKSSFHPQLLSASSDQISPKWPRDQTAFKCWKGKEKDLPPRLRSCHEESLLSVTHCVHAEVWGYCAGKRPPTTTSNPSLCFLLLLSMLFLSPLCASPPPPPAWWESQNHSFFFFSPFISEWWRDGAAAATAASRAMQLLSATSHLSSPLLPPLSTGSPPNPSSSFFHCFPLLSILNHAADRGTCPKELRFGCFRVMMELWQVQLKTQGSGFNNNSTSEIFIFMLEQISFKFLSKILMYLCYEYFFFSFLLFYDSSHWNINSTNLKIQSKRKGFSSAILEWGSVGNVINN